MKIKTSELTGAALDWAVAKCEGGYDLQLRSTYGAKTAWQYTMMDEDEPERMDKFYLADTTYSTDWQLAGPIIERENIAITGTGFDAYWNCDEGWYGHMEDRYAHGPTPLIAAMRCFVSSRLGDTVEVPYELTR